MRVDPDTPCVPSVGNDSWLLIVFLSMRIPDFDAVDWSFVGESLTGPGRVVRTTTQMDQADCAVSRHSLGAQGETRVPHQLEGSMVVFLIFEILARRFLVAESKLGLTLEQSLQISSFLREQVTQRIGELDWVF